MTNVIFGGGHSTCGWVVDFSDREIEACGDSKKIIRTWTWLDWCDGTSINPPSTATQVIEVKDLIEPELATQPTIDVVSPGHFECTADVVLPAASWTDNCGEINTFRTEIRQYVDSDGDGNFKEHILTSPVLWLSLIHI